MRDGLVLPLLILIAAIPLLVQHALSVEVPLVLGNVEDLDPDADTLLISPSDPLLVDLNGHLISNASSERQYMITVNATNRDDVRDWSTVLIIDVRDSSGVTTQLNWHIQTIDSGETVGVGVSWIPDHSDTYQVRTFAISDLVDPYVFSDVKRTEYPVS